MTTRVSLLLVVALGLVATAPAALAADDDSDDVCIIQQVTASDDDSLSFIFYNPVSAEGFRLTVSIEDCQVLFTLEPGTLIQRQVAGRRIIFYRPPPTEQLVLPEIVRSSRWQQSVHHMMAAIRTP